MKTLILGCALLLACGCSGSGPGSTGSGSSATNTAVNERDRHDGAKTPIDQNENKADVDMTAGIRKQVVALEASTDAHNVKIITQNGRVTLRGPVKNAVEKQKIEEIAFGAAGKANVESHLEVEAPK